MKYEAMVLKADVPDINGEIIPRKVLEDAIKAWNEKNDQIIEIYHGEKV